MIVQNRKELLSHGYIPGRKIALDLIDFTMEALDAHRLTRKLVRREKNLLQVGSLVYDLSTTGKVYVLGAGKAVLQIAEALEEILGNRIDEGVIIEKRLDGMTTGVERISRLKRIKVLQGGHPIPDGTAVRGAQEILRVAQKAKQGDLVFFCVQGGCTSLTTLPAKGLPLADVKKTTNLLLQSGLNIRVINAVRTAITTLSQGRLAQYIYPAEVITIVVNDYVSGFSQGRRNERYDSGWGPSVPISDSRLKDFEGALRLFRQHPLWKKVPEGVKNHLRYLPPEFKPQTMSEFEKLGMKYHTLVIADPRDGAETAKLGAEKMGLKAMILSSMIEGEASEVGLVFAGIAKEILNSGRPLPSPCALVAAGEKTVTLIGKHGKGGRNQEFALSAALKINGAPNITIASIGTDGTDGPTYIAGGIVDGETVRRADEQGIDLLQNLRDHNSSHVLTRLGDAIIFNEPGINICDLTMIIAP